jgi:phage-related tail protein
VSPIANVAKWFGSKEEKLKKLISKIAYEIWEADQQMLNNIREAEKAQNELQSPKVSIPIYALFRVLLRSFSLTLF